MDKPDPNDTMTERVENGGESAEKAVKFVCRLIVDSQYLTSVTWDSVLDTISEILDLDRERIREILKATGVSSRTGDSDQFQVAGIFFEDLPESMKPILYGKMVQLIKENPLLQNFVLSLSLSYALSKAIINSLVLGETRIGRKLQGSPLMAMCTSDLFLESREFNQFASETISKTEFPEGVVEKLVATSWFVDIIEILNLGLYGTNSLEVTRTIKEKWKDRDIAGLEELIESGAFLKILYHKSQILSDPKIRKVLTNKNRTEMREKNLDRFYAWLGIANDFSLGVEFLVGSLEFLPNMNELFGVFLFIVGSVQLTARAVISIVSRAHLESMRKKVRKNL